MQTPTILLVQDSECRIQKEVIDVSVCSNAFRLQRPRANGWFIRSRAIIVLGKVTRQCHGMPNVGNFDDLAGEVPRAEGLDRCKDAADLGIKCHSRKEESTTEFPMEIRDNGAHGSPPRKPRLEHKDPAHCIS